MDMLITSNLPYDFGDRSIRDRLKSISNLREFLFDTIPDIAPGLQFDKAEYLDNEFVTEDWRGRESDLLVRIPWQDGENSIPLLICVLIEHQSRPDSRMSFRTLLYSVLHWEREWKAWEAMESPRPDFQLTPIIPIVFHTGPQPWNTVRTIADLFAGPEIFKVFAPKWSVLLWDLAEKNPQTLLSSTSYWLKTLAVLRAGSQPFEEFEKTLLQVIVDLQNLNESEPVRWCELKHFVLSWCLKLRDAAERDRVLELARRVSETSPHLQEVRTEMPSIAESLLEEGRSQGIAQERRELLESLMLDRFGTIPSDVQTWIATTEDSNALRTAILQVNKANSLDDLRELGLFAH